MNFWTLRQFGKLCKIDGKFSNHPPLSKLLRKDTAAIWWCGGGLGLHKL